MAPTRLSPGGELLAYFDRPQQAWVDTYGRANPSATSTGRTAGFEMFFAEGGSPVEKIVAGPPDVAKFRRLVENHKMELLELPGH